MLSQSASSEHKVGRNGAPGSKKVMSETGRILHNESDTGKNGRVWLSRSDSYRNRFREPL